MAHLTSVWAELHRDVAEEFENMKEMAHLTSAWAESRRDVADELENVTLGARGPGNQ